MNVKYISKRRRKRNAADVLPKELAEFYEILFVSFFFRSSTSSSAFEKEKPGELVSHCCHCAASIFLIFRLVGEGILYLSESTKYESYERYSFYFLGLREIYSWPF